MSQTLKSQCSIVVKNASNHLLCHSQCGAKIEPTLQLCFEKLLLYVKKITL